MKMYDCIVVGGGFAGTAAALASARSGKKTLLLEQYNCLGGAACYDLVNPFMNFSTVVSENGEEHKLQLSAGIFNEILENLKRRNAMRASAFNEEELKLILNRMCEKSGVDVVFHAVVTDVQRSGNVLRSVSFSSFGKTYTASASMFIDASGDANLAEMAGCPYRLGREDSQCQPMTLCFRIIGIECDSIDRVHHDCNEVYLKAKESGKIKNPRENVLLFITTDKNAYHFNTTRVIRRNPTDPFDVTRAEFEAREQVFELFDLFREKIPYFANATLFSTGLQIGARESRMIDGEYVLNAEDIMSFTRFSDGIAACNYDIDIHSPDGAGTSHWYFPKGEYYTIPYRCLIPKGIKNLLVAGRCISVTHEAQASCRIMPVVCCIGEAAGTAAAMAVDDVRAVDTAELRKKLKANGAFVG
ncbi:MAG: FAD-dependent oxidoreductase [Clostridiales bacterium]|nr:FAD-dependent oxidoreductase [Clostridiales bacterium]